MSADFDAVTRTLQLYMDGLYYGDTNRLRQAFHPQARYVCATEEPVVNLGMDEYFPIVDARPSPASRNQPRQDRIQSIEFAGPNTAFARLNCAIGEKYFTDFLTLIYTDGQWRIINKAFHFDIQATAEM